MVPASSSKHPNVAVVQHHWRVEPHLRVAVGIREQRVVGVDELAAGLRPYASSRSSGGAPGPSGGGPNMNACCWAFSSSSSSTIIRPGPAAEAAEQCALAHACGRGDVVGGDGVGAALGYQATRSVQQ